MSVKSHAPDTSFQAPKGPSEWDTIPWHEVRKKVERLQMRIAKATPTWSCWVFPRKGDAFEVLEPYACPAKALSRPGMGNCHVRFLGETSTQYPQPWFCEGLLPMARIV